MLNYSFLWCWWLFGCVLLDWSWKCNIGANISQMPRVRLQPNVLFVLEVVNFSSTCVLLSTYYPGLCLAGLYQLLVDSQNASHNRNVNTQTDVCRKRQYAETVNSNIDIIFSKVWFSCTEYLARLSKQWARRSYFINLQPQEDQETYFRLKHSFMCLYL